MPHTLIEQNPLLFGHDERPSIIAIEPAGHFIRLFFRNGERVTFHDEPFQPFILVNNPALLSGCRAPCTVRPLTGEGFYRFQLLFDTWSDCLTARDFLVTKTAGNHPSSEAPFLFLSDLSHQYMLSSGTTLFKGMEFSELRCLALDIETDCAEGYGFSNADRAEDRIISIALKDSHGGELVLQGDQLGEAELLSALNKAIHDFDPDVITGHNIFRFDLEYIGRRAERHGIRLNWGRNGSAPHHTPHARWNLAEKTMDYPRWDIYGRHIIDTYFLVLLYDTAGRNLESHGLKAAARHFGLAAEDRTYLDGEHISSTFRQDPELLYRYNMDDVRETLALFRLLGYPWFLQSRIFPYSFQSCLVRGNGTRINALFLREYLHRGHAIPARAATGAPFEGGYTELRRQGIIGPIVHCDVASLYPSLMLTYRLAPPGDTLGLFLPMLADLRRFRLTAKQMASRAETTADRHYFNALQQLFKVLINSFYGYLGSTQHNFSDQGVAAEVTRLGRVTIKEMIELLQAAGAEPIEIDTDGIYFRPPDRCQSAGEVQELVRQVSAAFPPGIEVELDGRYQSMFAYKSKNYALLGDDGTIVIRGSALRSRGVEPFLREFMGEVIERLLTGKGTEVEPLFDHYLARLRSAQLEVSWVARSETLTESPARYRSKLQAGKRNHSAPFEIALASERPYNAGDRITYYVSGSGKGGTAYGQCRPITAFDPLHPDINISYYRDKLHHILKRFEPFLPQEPTLFDL